MSIEFLENEQARAHIKVVGIGGCGGNVIRYLINQRVHGVEYAAVNTDAQALAKVGAVDTLQIGGLKTGGLGAGGKPEEACKAAEEDIERIEQMLEGCNMVFVTSGMGKGTGTGASPVVARVAKSKGALTVAVVTKPFDFENRMSMAEQGIEELCKHVDSLIVVPNQKLLEQLDENIPVAEAFDASNRVLFNAVAGISEIITKPGEINLDFNDVRTVMSEMGMAVIGSACETGVDRAARAAYNAIHCKLLESTELSGARGVLINITASRSSITLREVSDVQKTIRQEMGAASDLHCFNGIVYDENMEDELRVTVIITGIARNSEQSIPALEAIMPEDSQEEGVFVSGRKQAQFDQIVEEAGGDVRQVPAIMRKQMN